MKLVLKLEKFSVPAFSCTPDNDKRRIGICVWIRISGLLSSEWGVSATRISNNCWMLNRKSFGARKDRTHLGGANTPAPNVGYCTNIDYVRWNWAMWMRGFSAREFLFFLFWLSDRQITFRRNRAGVLRGIYEKRRRFVAWLAYGACFRVCGMGLITWHVKDVMNAHANANSRQCDGSGELRWMAMDGGFGFMIVVILRMQRQRKTPLRIICDVQFCVPLKLRVC